MSRRVKIAVRRAAEEHGPIPLTAFVRSLGAIQRATCQIAAMLSETTSERSRGSFSAAVLQACSYQIVELKFGSGVAELELPSRGQAQFPEMDLGVLAADKLLELSRLLTTEQSWEQVAALLPAEGYRRQVLKTYQDICPTDDEELVVTVQDTLSGTPALALTARERALARVYAVKRAVDDLVERLSFIGRLTRLDSEPGFTFGLKQGTRQFDFPGDPQRMDELIDLWREKAWVRVDAVARIIRHDDRDDDILELLDVDGVVEVDMSPLNISEFALDDHAVVLAEPLAVSARAEGGLIVYEYPALRIMACGPTPQDAEAEFREELAWLWDSYANAPDDDLTADARDLKTRLHQLVEGGM